MSGLLLLTWRHLRHERLQSLLLLFCIAATAFLPAALHVLVNHYERELKARAASTPYVLGAAGNRYDLVLKSLYFSAQQPRPIDMAAVDAARADERADVIPLELSYSAQGLPLVGTTLAYFDYRQLTAAAGTMPLLLGDCVLGAAAARKLGLGPGDRLLTDQARIFELAAAYPLDLHVSGVLAPNDSPDDNAAFCDMRTTWIVAGIGHGHVDLATNAPSDSVLTRNDHEVVGNAALVQYRRITEANIASFHFHGDRGTFPVSAAIVVPHSAKDGTMLAATYRLRPQQLLVPAEVVRELMSLVLRVRRFMDANFAVIGGATTLFLGLIFALSVRLRRRETETLFKLGCSRSMVARMQCAEVLLIAIGGIAIGLAGAALLRINAPALLNFL